MPIPDKISGDRETGKRKQTVRNPNRIVSAIDKKINGIDKFNKILTPIIIG